MAFVSLDDKSGYVPGFDAGWFEDVLVVKIEALDSMEQIDDLLLFLVVWECTIFLLWWPILELEVFSISKETHHSFPFFLCKSINWVINFKGHLIVSNLSAKSLLAIILFIWVRISRSFSVLYVLTTTHEVNCILQSQVAWVFTCWHNNDWSACTPWRMAHFHNLFQNRPLFLCFAHNNIRQFCLMLENVNVGTRQKPVLTCLLSFSDFSFVEGLNHFLHRLNFLFLILKFDSFITKMQHFQKVEMLTLQNWVSVWKLDFSFHQKVVDGHALFSLDFGLKLFIELELPFSLEATCFSSELFLVLEKWFTTSLFELIFAEKSLGPDLDIYWVWFILLAKEVGNHFFLVDEVHGFGSVLSCLFHLFSHLKISVNNQAPEWA